MKAVLVAILLGIPLATSVASAEVRVVNDPSGAPMCVDASDTLVPLAHCEAILEAERYQLVRDPSGAPMCADAEGKLAPLARCAAKLPLHDSYAFYQLVRDPSGAPMCADGDGRLAPLARCENRFRGTVVSTLVAEAARLTVAAR